MHEGKYDVLDCCIGLTSASMSTNQICTTRHFSSSARSLRSLTRRVPSSSEPSSSRKTLVCSPPRRSRLLKRVLIATEPVQWIGTVSLRCLQVKCCIHTYFGWVCQSRNILPCRYLKLSVCLRRIFSSSEMNEEGCSL
jgi:hypothetical protein